MFGNRTLWRLIRAPGSRGGAEGGAGWPCFAGCQDYQRRLVTCWIMSVGSVTGVRSLDGRVVSPPQMTGSPFMGSSIPTSEAPRESSACWSSFPRRGLLLLTLLEAQTRAPHQAASRFKGQFHVGAGGHGAPWSAGCRRCLPHYSPAGVEGRGGLSRLLPAGDTMPRHGGLCW